MASPNSGRKWFTLADLEVKTLKTVNIPEGRNHSVQPDLYFPFSFSVISRAELAEIFSSPQRVLKKNLHMQAYSFIPIFATGWVYRSNLSQCNGITQQLFPLTK